MSTQFPNPVAISIAQMSDDDIRAMSRADLVDLVRLSNGQPPQEPFGYKALSISLPYLRRLATAVRDRCKRDTEILYNAVR